MAPPLAGSMNMHPAQFFGLDLVGASLYTGVYWGTGFLFSGLVDAISAAYTNFSHLFAVAIAVGLLAWFGWHAFRWFRARSLSPVPRVSVAEVAQRRQSMAIYDVRSHGYYEKGALRIAGSSRIEPHALHQRDYAFPEGKEIVLYCTCYREVTAERVARLLAERGIAASVIGGSFQAWKDAGLPVEPVPDSDMVELPTFG